MKIIYFIDSLNFGGAEMLLYRMLESYTKADHDIHVAYFTDGPLHDRILELGVPIHRISSRGLKDPFSILRTIQLIQKIKPDVVHTHLSKSDLIGQLGAAILQVPARVLTNHNTDPWRKKRLLSGIMRLITSGCQKLIAVSPIVRDYLIQWSGFPEEKIVVIENGIDLSRFNPAAVEPIDRSKHWRVPDGNLAVGVIGRLHPQKNHNIFLNASKIMVEYNPKISFIVIGDGPLRGELKAQTRNLGLQHNVIFTGNVDNIPAALASLNLVVFSSNFEGLPVSLLEAMAMKKPVVATAVGGIPGVITNGLDGVLIPPRNPEILAERSLEILENPDLALRLSQNARMKIEQKYDDGKMHKKIMIVYRSLVQQNNEFNKQLI